MSGVAVVTDSTSCLGPDLASHAGIRVIPLQVVIDGRSSPETERPASDIAAALRAGSAVSTSRPTPEVIAATYAEVAAAGYEAMVSVHLSSQISGTYEAALTAAGTSELPIRVIDSGTVGMATGFSAIAGKRASTAGATLDQVADLIERRAAASTTYFSVATLEYLRRGGRIGPAAARIGSALSIKPLLTLTDGQIRACERVRTLSKARSRLEELGVAALARAAGRTDRVDVAVHHLDEPEAAGRLAERLAGRLTGSQIVVTEVSAVLAVHVGPGVLGIVVSPQLD